MKYEYKVIPSGVQDCDTRERLLNFYADLGWEFIAASGGCFYLRRPIP